tara:strand:- start:592 stop:1395 length:804 start_codon:yes stop_codon:yes gene_type:complete
LIVLTYHKILSSSAFERQIKYLIKNYQIVGLNSNINSSKNLIISADDGDPSFYEKAFPILKKYNIPAILFVVTDLINSKKPFWWDEVEYYLGKVEGNIKVWEVKDWPNIQRVEYLENLRKTSTKPRLNFDQLSIKQLREMQASGITIANHSHTHPMLDKCTLEEVDYEIRCSTEKLKELNFCPNIFAYPNGNHSIITESVLSKYGIEKAFLFDHKITKSTNHQFRISRLIVNDYTPMWKFKLILSGFHGRILPITRFVGTIKSKIRN